MPVRFEALCRVTLMTLVTLTLLLRESEGHGRLLVPPARGTMWREGFDTPRHFTDNELNCGGFTHQWDVHGGQCGVCGDPYDLPQPRPNENGGTYGRGVIAREYTQGQVIEVDVQITANHLGWFEFRLCVLVDRNSIATPSCLGENLLELETGGTRYPAGDRAMTHRIAVRLPEDVSCDQCVFQWKYRGGNNWGSDESGDGMGYGPQEEFYGCADVKIVSDGGEMTPTPTPTTTTTTTTTTPTPTPTPTTTTTTTQNPVFDCVFIYNPTGDARLDALCACACDVNTGVCENDLCGCYEVDAPCKC